jgi:hypothetical protein
MDLLLYSSKTVIVVSVVRSAGSINIRKNLPVSLMGMEFSALL